LLQSEIHQPTEDTTHRPEVYQQLDQWLNDQRLLAAQQLTEVNLETVESTHTIQPATTDKTTSQITQPAETDKRAIIKAKAKEKISAVYRTIPQIDGHITDSSQPSSAEASAQPSTNPSPHVSPAKPSAMQDPEFVDQLRTCHSSLDWDYQEINVIDDATALDEVFDDPYVDVDFLQRHASV
jgi:hypothetical protein